MTFSDIFTSNILDNVTAVTPFDMAVVTFLAFVMGLFISLIYNCVYQGAMYSTSFAVSMAVLPMITATLILTVTSNVMLSLGMVGALSIVRFRTAIKDPLEIVFLFWAIETGIVLPAGILPLAVCVNIIIGFVLQLLVKSAPRDRYILVVRCDESSMREVQACIKENTRSYNEKAVFSKDATTQELDAEVFLNGRATASVFIRKLNEIDGVQSAQLVTYNGAYTA